MKLRPRFSVRSLVILVTVVCMYFGLWEITKRQAGDSPGPLVIRRHMLRTIAGKARMSGGSTGLISYDERVTCYFLWLFGPTFKIPYEVSTVLPPNIMTPLRQ